MLAKTFSLKNYKRGNVYKQNIIQMATVTQGLWSLEYVYYYSRKL